MKPETLLKRARRRKKNTTKTGKLSKAGRSYIANAKILHDRGILENSIKAVGRNTFAKVGTTRRGNKYGPTHQFGRSPVPARPFIQISADDIRVMKAILITYIGTKPQSAFSSVASRFF